MTFSDGREREEPFALGLPAGRLAVLGAALAVGAAMLRAPLPEGLRVGLASAVLVAAALLAWGRLLEVPFSLWTLRLLGWVGRRLVQRLDQARWT
ncbi:MAG: hypothetical protein WBU92_03505 [Candidatus Dormiibacterota bacterium]